MSRGQAARIRHWSEKPDPKGCAQILILNIAGPSSQEPSAESFKLAETENGGGAVSAAEVSGPMAALVFFAAVAGAGIVPSNLGCAAPDLYFLGAGFSAFPRTYQG